MLTFNFFFLCLAVHVAGEERHPEAKDVQEAPRFQLGQQAGAAAPSPIVAHSRVVQVHVWLSVRSSLQ